MRQVKEHVLDSGERRYRVRYRSGGQDTSETFRRKADAKTFATLLDSGDTPSDGVLIALEWKNAREKNQDVPTFGEFFVTYAEQLTGITLRTRNDYHALHRRYLTELDALPLPLIGRSHVTAIVNRLEAEGKSAKTIKNTIHMLSSVLALAVEESHIAKNPCNRVKLPRAGLDRVDARFLEYEDFVAILNEIPEHYKPFVTFLVGTGMRWSEATAVYGRHVNIAAGTVRVEQAWKWEGKGRGWKIGVPKTDRGRRTVNAASMALAAALNAKPNELVFTTPTGLPIRHNNFYARIWVPAVKRAGFVDKNDKPTVRIHDLRHTHASWLIAEGMTLEQVQDQLGHENIHTTRRVYGGLMPALGVEVGKAASAVLNRVLGGSSDPVELGSRRALGQS